MYQLRKLVEADANSTWNFDTYYTYRWHLGGAGGWKRYHGPHFVRCNPEACFVLVALEYGLYEFWTTANLDNSLRGIILHLVTASLSNNCLGKGDGFRDPPTPPPFDRLIRSLAICLADGTEANSLMPVHEFDTAVSVWQNLVWHNIVTTDCSASVAPAWLLFLLHGADRSFTLSFELSCNFSSIDKCAKLFQVTGHWGQDNHQVHSPVYIREDEDEGGILELAKCHDWSVPLRELTYFWFPPHADRFRRIYDFYEGSVDIQVEKLNDLRRELGFDSAYWQSHAWGKHQPLIPRGWEGVSRILTRSGENDFWDPY